MTYNVLSGTLMLLFFGIHGSVLIDQSQSYLSSHTLTVKCHSSFSSSAVFLLVVSKKLVAHSPKQLSQYKFLYNCSHMPSTMKWCQFYNPDRPLT